MPLYGGIDLHANNSVIVLLNEQDEVIYGKRLPNALYTGLDQLAAYRTEMKGLVVESTYNWYWLVDGLMEAGYQVHLANPAAIQQYSGLKYTDDHSDARWLAHLLRLGVSLNLSQFVVGDKIMVARSQSTFNSPNLCRVGRAVTHPGPSPDPDERISRIRLFRRCGSWLHVSTTFTSSGDMVSNVKALAMVPF